MTVRNKIRFFVYRMHEKGLEILSTRESVSFQLLHLNALEVSRMDHLAMIEFQSYDADGVETTNLAIEADWHEIPRVRTLIRKDIQMVKDSLAHWIPEMTDCAYVSAKEAFKKALPQEYSALKELKDILLDRNLVKNI